MARRLEVELTSARPDGTWTWRAAGAREPRGAVDGSLLPAGAAVGDQLRVEADFTIEGIDIVAVLPPKEAKAPKAQTLELVGTRRDEPLVTSTLVGKRGRDGDDRPRRGGGPRGDRGDRGDRGARGDRPDRSRAERGRGGPGGRADRDGRSGGADRPRRNQERRAPQEPSKPAPKRLRARRVHRKAALADLPAEQRPLAELVLRGGVPEVRAVLDRQKAMAAAENQPVIRGELLVGLAERLLPSLKRAEWRDRADAALAQIDDVDLRDLRSVVSAAETAARDDESRALADQIRAGLTQRVDREHHEWLAELSTMLQEGRIVRALRLSSRPPKAGSPLPPEIAGPLAEQATAGLTGDVTEERFSTLLEAVSFSPVHQRVAATSIPTAPTDQLLAIVRKFASRVPAVAAQFGVTSAKSPAKASAAAPQPADA